MDLNTRIRKLQDLARGCSKMAREQYGKDNNEMGDHFSKKCSELEAKAANLRLEEMGIR